jgi:hypothetical protein
VTSFGCIASGLLFASVCTRTLYTLPMNSVYTVAATCCSRSLLLQRRYELLLLLPPTLLLLLLTAAATAATLASLHLRVLTLPVLMYTHSAYRCCSCGYRWGYCNTRSVVSQSIVYSYLRHHHCLLAAAVLAFSFCSAQDLCLHQVSHQHHSHQS